MQVAQPPPAPTPPPPPAAKKSKPRSNDTWKMVVKLKHEESIRSLTNPKNKGEMLDTSLRYNMAVANIQVNKMMRPLKNPDTNQTFWQCTECDYFNKSAKSSKFKVKSHVLKQHVNNQLLRQDTKPRQDPQQQQHHQQQQEQPRAQEQPEDPVGPDAMWKTHSWMEGQPFTSNGNNQPPMIKVTQSPYDPVAVNWNPTNSVATVQQKPPPVRLSPHQVATMMRTLKDVDSGQSYWQCTKCDYFSANPKSSKYKVERHIMRQHLDMDTSASDTLWMEGEPITMNAYVEYQPPSARATPQPFHPPITHSVPPAPKRDRTEEYKQAEIRMWSLKDPETGKTFWRCTECDYFNKSEKCSKGKVRTHVLNHHMGLSASEVKEGKGGRPKKEKSELDLQVESLMGSIKDPTTRRVIWLCTKCNYSQSRTGKSKSSKDKMRRHILRKHIEGGKAIALLKFCQSPKDPTKTVPRFTQIVQSN